MRAAFTFREVFARGRKEGRLLLGGHRGNPHEQPENTLPSFESAIAVGCDLVECDVHVCADGHLVVIHDHTLERTTNGTGLVAAKTLAELRELDAGHGERIPVLAEVLELVRGRVPLVIETKQNPIPYPDLEERLIAQVREQGMSEQVSVISFHHGRIKRLKELAPEFHAAIIDACRPVDPVAMMRSAKADGFSSHYGTLDPEMVEEIRSAGGAVGVWTVDDDLALVWSKHCRPDSVFSNRPGLIGPQLN